MASSSSVKHSQKVIACQLCETSKNIKVKCMDCKLLMCEPCKNRIHLKFKNADNHTIVLLKDIVPQNENESKDFKLVKCEDHANQFFCMYCSACKKLVCPKCVSTEHQKHRLLDIETICVKKMDQVADCQEQMNTSIHQYLQKLETLSEMEETKYQKIRQQMLSEEMKMKEEIQQRYAAGFEKLQKEKQLIDNIIAAKKENISKDIVDIARNQREVADIFKRGDTVKILNSTRDLRQKFDNVLRETLSENRRLNTFCCVPEIVSLKMNSQIERIELKVEASYKRNAFVNSITVDNKGSLWAIEDDNTIYHLDMSHDLEERQHCVVDDAIGEIRCGNSGEIFLTSGTKILLKSGKRLNKFKDFSQDRPLTLHILKSNDIIVGLDCRQHNDTSNKPVILLLASNGEVKHEYLNVNNMLLMYNVVGCIGSFKDDNVCFVDSDWSNITQKGRVVKLKSNGTIEWTYSGNRDVTTADKLFDPVEVLVTERENCLISDKCNNSYAYFHILSLAGSVLSVLDLTIISIERADVMTLDKKCHLFVTEKNIIHLIKFSGF